jgi:epidermal growth factor receptor substrate 15
MKAQLPNSVLSTIWNLADVQQQGALTVVEFIVALHLLFSYKDGSLTALPTICPPQLFEAAARSVHPDRRPGAPTPATIPRQFSGEPRTSSPANRPPFRSPQAATEWAINPQDRAQFGGLFDKIDEQRLGYINGDQAYSWFTNSMLPQETLAQIWELATVRKADQLNRDEFAVAMYLIKSQRGKTTSDLPATLPPNLVPPSLRSIVPPAAPQSTGYQAPPPVAQPPPKSAAEDLFGLDELSSTVTAPIAPVQQQTTGGSGRAFNTDPFGTKTSSSPTSSTFQPPGFKRFIPTSSFGQNLQAQNTGGSGTSSSRDVPAPATRAPQPSAMDDLLGDADPEISKRLTNETAELANMSNQIGQLRTQMQEVQTKKTVTESEINRTSTQKRDLELRLSQFRQQYEEEVKTVKVLEQQLQSLRSDTQKTSREMAMLEGTYQDLQTQHHQAATALDNERRENASLKERMAQITQEIARLRPELEKMRSDTRHEKGMVSISKKQLERSETERDAVKSEMDNLKSAQAAPPAVSREVSNVASPASATSQNPFFRKLPQPSFDQNSARSASEDHNKFGNIWGTAFSSSPATSAPPPTSFGPFGTQSGPSIGSSEQNVPTPSASPPTSSYRDSPRGAVPPELPESRQFTPGDLPIRGAGTESTASVRVETPGSRWEGTATPTAPSTASPAQPTLDRSETQRSEMTSTGAAMFNRTKTASPVASTKSDMSKGKVPDHFSPTTTIPGAFPGTAGSPIQSNLTGESSFTSGSKDTPRTDTFSAFSASGQGASRTSTNAWKGDFDAAFASLAPTQQRQNTGSSANGAVDPLKKAEHQFPPLEIHEEDSDDSELGFGDDFTVPSPESKKTMARPMESERPTSGHGKDDDFFKPRTATAASPSELPPVTAQKSPPTYEQSTGTASATAAGAAREANNFPPEFGGLLPQRETQTSLPQTVQSPSQGAALFGGSGGFFGEPSKPGETTSSSTVPSGDYQSAVSQQSTADKSTGQTSLTQGGQSKPFGSFGTDDFDNFDDLEDAKADDGKDDDIFGPDNSFETFDPSFDSPAASKSNTLASEFDSGFGKSSTMSASGVTKSSGNTNWDNLVRGMDAPAPPTGPSMEFKKSSPFPDLAASQSSSKPFGEGSAENMQFPEAPEPPKLGRALSEGTEHDDPILKTLTGMGYERNMALEALEKYDYNLDKV